MDIAVGIPERIDRVAVMACLSDLERTHLGILSIDILEDIGVDLQMIE